MTKSLRCIWWRSNQEKVLTIKTFDYETWWPYRQRIRTKDKQQQQSSASYATEFLCTSLPIVGGSVRLHPSTVSRIIMKLTNAICEEKNRFIFFPWSRQAAQTIKEEFHEVAGFPNVLGAIYGTFISIIAPKCDESLFVSKKGEQYCGNLQFKDELFYAVAKYPGATNDAYIWSDWNLFQLFQNENINNGLLLGGSG